MARLIPPVYVDTGSSGEAEIFKAFEGDDFSRDWIVLHSFDIPRHMTQGEGEADFVVLIPGCGVLCLEIKASAEISRRGGMWRYGGVRDARGPFKQVRENTFSLMRRIKGENRRMRNVPFFGLAVFTRCNFRSLDLGGAKEWADIDFIDSADIASGNLTRTLKRLFLAQAERHGLSVGDFTGDKFEEMAAMMRPDFEYMMTPRERMLASDAEARKYTREQFRILDSISANERIVVDGLAGTGKTALAIEYARRFSASASVMLVTPARELGEFLADEARLPPSGFAGSVDDFKRAFTGPGGGFLRPEKFGVLVVDEAQDLVGGDFFGLMDSALEGGLAGGRWIMFGDYYSRSADFEHARLFSEFRRKYSPALCSLSENCRNPVDIARLVEAVSGLDRGYSGFMRAGSGSKPVVKFCGTLREETGELVGILESLLGGGVPARSIAVLKGAGEDAASPLLASKNWGPKFVSDYGCDGIFHGAIVDFKGLEADFVILTGLGNLGDEYSRRMFYIGATRAKSGLYILAGESLRPLLGPFA